MREDIIIFNNLDFGKLLPSLNGSLKNIFKATKKAIDAKRYFNSFTLKYLPERPPIIAPKNIPGAHFFIISISIDPL
jgi:hypothetical protein